MPSITLWEYSTFKWSRALWKERELLILFEQESNTRTFYERAPKSVAAPKNLVVAIEKDWVLYKGLALCRQLQWRYNIVRLSNSVTFPTTLRAHLFFHGKPVRIIREGIQHSNILQNTVKVSNSV
ncbi:hypothetical protein AVEN_242888-1 [Araneus ventricosus]|uniref:Uncharacterized protein n=1 Tax=Araneus ventricosus TaxID=182803 RepID=A0A4Y2KRB9_ARAVE|nr:hypothetical protein AVEN_242888-1 [Araneus ventricosus]